MFIIIMNDAISDLMSRILEEGRKLKLNEWKAINRYFITSDEDRG